jgi:hypothetical protein
MTEHCPLPHLYKVTDTVTISGNRPSRYGLPKKIHQIIFLNIMVLTV